jgi:hypothetical protein
MWQFFRYDFSSLSWKDEEVVFARTSFFWSVVAGEAFDVVLRIIDKNPFILWYEHPAFFNFDINLDFVEQAVFY